MTEIKPLPLLEKSQLLEGKVGWKSPSNIALVKYWGKRPVQLPENASISFTLSEAHTTTSVNYAPRMPEKPWITFTFEGKKEQAFSERISKYCSSLLPIMPFLNQLSFDIESRNSFPHSSGIASSASSMSALALCLCDIEQVLYKLENDEHAFFRKASMLARLGSGSASRSVYPKLVAWGRSKVISDARDEYAIPVHNVHPVFETFHDDVLIVSEEKKSVSSTAGHALMDTNIFAEKRYQQAEDHMAILLKSMGEGNLEIFGKVVEDEALTLHALMMCSDPSYILMEPGTIAVIKRIRAFRSESGLPIFFTLDAGPNVHILYPESIAKQADEFINEALRPLAFNNRIIKDVVGNGPIKFI